MESVESCQTGLGRLHWSAVHQHSLQNQLGQLDGELWGKLMIFIVVWLPTNEIHWSTCETHKRFVTLWGIKAGQNQPVVSRHCLQR